MKVQVGDQAVTADVDTAAQVTIISDKVYDALQRKPKRLRTVQLMTAGRKMGMKGFVVGPVKLKIGEQWYREQLYVAPIEQEMLLGFDLLRRWSAMLDMGRGILTFDSQVINLNVGERGEVPDVNRVTVAKRQVIPPSTVMRVKCSLDQKMPDYVVEPVHNVKVLVPRVVRGAGAEPLMCVMNTSDRYRLLRKGMEIGRAYPVDGFLDSNHDSCDETPGACGVTEGSPDSPDESYTLTNGIPVHLQHVYLDSSKHLNEDQKIQLAQLLIEFQDVFARDEFDLGKVTKIEHSIDTDDAKAVRQRMRRTPATFVGKGEAHLGKMLKAGVIQESTSEWASAPFLIQKRDGSVRWCIDNRSLNDVTLKDVFPLPLVDDCLDTLAGSV
ncbi:uncharacterized protein LOC123553066 [Mercenaria mercenaria]|uniref:uncharacterized protein LOC123553066 n=1 Tax=Mercenaria mercenaria TaxID=6596 RepID=UPI001E1E01EB|nr:uncharacterized protein LOC123553066 [Mercenaria mercenaria]